MALAEVMCRCIRSCSVINCYIAFVTNKKSRRRFLLHLGNDKGCGVASTLYYTFDTTIKVMHAYNFQY